MPITLWIKYLIDNFQRNRKMKVKPKPTKLSFIKVLSVYVFLSCLNWQLNAFGQESSIVYIQSKSTQLKSLPQNSAPMVTEVMRGDELTVIKKEGIWLQVKTSNNQEGYVPKVLTSTVKPIGQTQLLKDTAVLDTKAKSSRRRTTDYAVSAATRGLSAGERHRPGEESFRSNRKAVEVLEKIKISPEKVKKFREEASVTEK